MNDVNHSIEIKGEINTLDDRAAMALPQNHVSLKFQDISKVIRTLHTLSRDELGVLIETPAIPLLQRYAAGQLLGLLGDVRIKIFEPEMILIPKGSARIGTSVKEAEKVSQLFHSLGVKKEWIMKETPQFEWQINAFKMGKYPISNSEYLEFLEDTRYHELPTSWQFGRYPQHLSNHPVYSVSETAAEVYTQWLSHKTQRNFRLPSEVEWEYAARGLDGREYTWGNEFKENHCNTAEFGLFSSTPIGLFTEGKSPFGLLDMAGNVEEFTANHYWVYPGGTIIEDDLAITRNTYKVARGGSFTRFCDLARCARRHGFYHKPIYVMGFRLAETI